MTGGQSTHHQGGTDGPTERRPSMPDSDRPDPVTHDEIRASKARVRARLLMELVRRDLDAVHASRAALTATAAD
ncbi:MAG: hypothetical protein D8M59_01000 [Planctomycetes bacterium]|nr:hypothetical protein [Planctomycetota bacterium]NOG54702.1 hypothetical protein [Planctomycetota bacterium]